MDLNLKTISSVAIIACLMLIPVSSISKGNVTERLAQAQFTTQVSKRKPVNNLKSLDTGYRHVYFFVDVRKCKNCKIEHQWWYRGKMISSVEGRIKGKRYRWWSKKNISGGLGDWTVKVFLDGELEYSKTITYHKATLKQQQARPINNRMEIQSAGECEIQLRYFSDKASAEPDDVYYRFMLKKWGKRCLPE